MTWEKNIENHYRDVWSVEPEICGFSAGPIGQLPHGFSVLRFPPRGDRKMWTYATRCMSLPEDAKPIELHMFSPREAVEVVELLVVTSHFHRTSTKLDVGHSVNFGRPWLDASACEFGLISRPYLDGPKLEIMLQASREISFYWLIPVTKFEVEFKKKNGIERLEGEFDRSGFDYVNPARRSVV